MIPARSWLQTRRARDWIMFTAGVARYYEDRDKELAALLASTLPRTGAKRIHEIVASAADRLHPVQAMASRLGTSARAVARAILTLRYGTAMLLFALVLVIDVVADGDLDIFSGLE